METRFNIYFVFISVLVLGVPLVVMPFVVDNAFNSPKTLLLLFGVSAMVGIYGFQILNGLKFARPIKTPIPTIILFLILLNVFSLFYTVNPYFTAVAATLNISCLLLFYFVSTHIDGKKMFWLLLAISFGGLFVSIITWLQSFGVYILFKWLPPGSMIMGTIGNSNFLGAYLVFPLYAMTGLIFLLKGKFRWIPIVLLLFMLSAFLFARARSSWVGFLPGLSLFFYLLTKIKRFSFARYIGSKPKRMAPYVIMICILLIVLWFIIPPRFHIMTSFGKIIELQTLRLRVQKWYRPSFWLFEQRPLFGTGLWSYRSLVYEAQSEINKTHPGFFERSNPKPRRAHNEYLEILNDGGLVAAAALSLFLVLVLRHGWRVIKDEELDEQDRIISATAFCAILNIMITAIFFFPFRVNSTMFMTVLMLGLMEGIYLRNYDHIMIDRRPKSETGFLIPILFFLIIGVIWYTGIKPFKGEMSHFKYKLALAQGRSKDAEKHILKAIDYDPHNSLYLLYASQLYLNVLKDYGKASDFIERVITDFNGDLTLWSVYYIKGVINFRMGSLFEARAAFEKSLYYYPLFEPAIKNLKEVKDVIKNHDKVLIKFR